MSSNSFVLAQKMLPILDAIYKKEALTAPLEVNPDNVQFVGVDTVKIMKMVMDGLGNYSRADGFNNGGIQTTWETKQLTKDRSASFHVDYLDNEESMGMIMAKLMGEFMRTKVIPELDAYRFSVISGTSGINKVSADITPGTTDCVGLLDTAEEVLGDAEVPEDGRILYVSEKFYRGLKNNVTREWVNENGVQRNVLKYNHMEVRRAPVARFCTGITLFDGTTSGQTDGGYKFTATTSKPINFMIVHPSSIIQVTKHVAPRLFAPNENQKADAYLAQYRVFHDLLTEENKLKGIYVHTASTGITADIVG